MFFGADDEGVALNGLYDESQVLVRWYNFGRVEGEGGFLNLAIVIKLAFGFTRWDTDKRDFSCR